METDQCVHADVRTVAVVDQTLVDVALAIGLVLPLRTVRLAVAHEAEWDAGPSPAVELVRVTLEYSSCIAKIGVESLKCVVKSLNIVCQTSCEKDK